MNNCALLAPEWERIDLLGTSLTAARRGAGIPQEMGQRLGALQQEVLTLRRRPPWWTMVKECSLDQLDQDILACSLAPEAEPRLGWMYQELQPGISSTYPTPALIREMFVMGAEESAASSNAIRPISIVLFIPPPGHVQGYWDGRPRVHIPCPALLRPLRQAPGTIWCCRRIAFKVCGSSCCGSPTGGRSSRNGKGG